MATLQSLADLGINAEAAAPEAPKHVQKLDSLGRAYATGKRKDAVARVWIKPGSGKIVINGRTAEVYFARPVLRMILGENLRRTLLPYVDPYIFLFAGGMGSQYGNTTQTQNASFLESLLGGLAGAGGFMGSLFGTGGMF